VIRIDKEIKNGQMVKTEQRGYLIPEFVSLTGMSDEQKSNYQTMKEIAPYTKLTPDERLQNTEKLINSINGLEFKIDKPRMVGGYQLSNPAVRLASNNIYSADNGNLNFKDKVKMAIPFKDWVVVYSRGKYAENDDGDADNLAQLIFSASKAFGIQFSEPGFITCESNINSWKN
jgi:aubergine-like protein